MVISSKKPDFAWAKPKVTQDRSVVELYVSHMVAGSGREETVASRWCLFSYPSAQAGPCLRKRQTHQEVGKVLWGKPGRYKDGLTEHTVAEQRNL